jgi:hypothetical protein
VPMRRELLSGIHTKEACFGFRDLMGHEGR